MRRETTNRIRFVIEELLPPIVRDSRLFAFLCSLVWGDHIYTLAKFRQNAAGLTPAEYERLYREHPRVHTDTDNSQATLDRILKDVEGPAVCDIGCGTGYLLRHIKAAARKPFANLTGVDFVVPEGFSSEGITFIEAPVETLPFPDKIFDTVICTHVVEHILDYRKAIAELRRIANKRLIIVVPREREGLYTFNPHFNFFPYKSSFLRAMIPLPRNFECIEIGRDIYYTEWVE